VKDERRSSEMISTVPNEQSMKIGPGEKGIAIEDIDKRIELAVREAERRAHDEINKQIQATQALYLTIFGIFASIVSFLTVEFQFLKTGENIRQITGLSLILFAALLGFVLALDYLVKAKSQSRFFILCAVTVILFVTGIWLIIGCLRAYP
jgi:NAD/NADP transhydrogenase beta subunit